MNVFVCDPRPSVIPPSSLGLTAGSHYENLHGVKKLQWAPTFVLNCFNQPEKTKL
jgi:hypothetical protein